MLGNIWGFIKKQWLPLLIGAVALILILSAIFHILTPPQPARPPADAQNAWQGIVPNFSSVTDVQRVFGQPLASKQTDNGTELRFKSEFPALPNTVVADSQGKVLFMKEYVPFKAENPDTLNNYVQKWGQPDLELFEPTAGNAVRAHVFLSKGVVVIAHINGGVVEQKWYFSPTTQETFLTSWGKALSNEAEGPESLGL